MWPLVFGGITSLRVKWEMTRGAIIVEIWFIISDGSSSQSSKDGKSKRRATVRIHASVNGAELPEIETFLKKLASFSRASTIGFRPTWLNSLDLKSFDRSILSRPLKPRCYAYYKSDDNRLCINYKVDRCDGCPFISRPAGSIWYD